MSDLLITGGTVVPMDPQRRIIENGAVAIRDGRILDVGPADDLAARFPDMPAHDARGTVVLPGLIDVHAHAGHGLIKTMGMHEGNRWEDICGEVYTTGSTPEFWYAEARLAACERLRFGVTTGVSLLGGGDTIMRSDDPAYGVAHISGVIEVGTRSVVAVGPTRAPHPRRYANGGATPQDVSFDTQLATCATLIDDWHGASDNRIRIALLYPVLRNEHERDMAPGDYEEARRQTIATRALSRDAGILFTQDGHWRGSVERAHDLGLLGPDALLSHAIDLSDAEIRLCADTQTRIAHNPSAVASMLGRCPVPELLSAGVTVGLGSDATAPDRSGDMFRHMQQAMHYHRTRGKDPGVLPIGKTLEMATIDAARALGLEDEIGSLEPGKRADLILIDMNRPHLSPPNMPVHRVVCFANGNDVDTVIIGGEICLRNGHPTRVSTETILSDAAREAERMINGINAGADLTIPDGFWGAVTTGDGA